MIVTQVALWAWVPITLSALATQSQGGELGIFGQFLVPGSAAASVITCVWLFLQRMAKAAEENAATISGMLESQDGRVKDLIALHKEAIFLVTEKLADNTSVLREMNNWIRECVQHIPRDKP